MRIYVDFDDVICETARHLMQYANQRYGTSVSYEDIRWFELRKSLRLDDEQYVEVMQYAHHDAILALYPPAAGAVEVLSHWLATGHSVFIVTGRPATTRDASRQWLVNNGFPEIPVICVDKYRREKPPPFGIEPALTTEEFAALHFDIAIEDAPAALDLLAASKCQRIFIFDRPWNSSYQLPDSRYVRADGWTQIAAMLACPAL